MGKCHVRIRQCLKQAVEHREYKWGRRVKKLHLDKEKFQELKHDFNKVFDSKKAPKGYWTGLPFLYNYLPNGNRVRSCLLKQRMVGGKLYLVTCPRSFIKYFARTKEEMLTLPKSNPQRKSVQRYVIDLDEYTCYRILHVRKEDNLLIELAKSRKVEVLT